MGWASIFLRRVQGLGNHWFVHLRFTAGLRGVSLTAALVMVFALVAGMRFSEAADAVRASPGKFQAQIQRLLLVESAVAEWWKEHEALPEALDQLVEADGYLKQIPKDLYAPGRSVSYRLARGNRFAIIYSYGPDGDDDGGVSIPVYRLDASVRPRDGDIVIHVRPRPADEFVGQEVFEILSFMKEQDGRDNALIHYVEAEKLQPELSEMPDNDYEYGVIRHVLEKGWDEGLTELRDYLVKWQPMFEKIRQGTRVAYARNIGVTRSFKTPVPNSIAASYGGKMLCVEGRYLESQGKCVDALDNYLTALTMGRDHGSPGGWLIHGYISVAIQRAALESIYRLVTTDTLRRPALDRLASHLREIERSQVSVSDSMMNECLAMEWHLAGAKHNPQQLRRSVELTRKMDEGCPDADLVEDAIRQIDRVQEDWIKALVFEIEYIDSPYWERDSESRDRAREAFRKVAHPLAAYLHTRSHENFCEADVRYRAMMAKLCLTRIVTALAAYKLDHEGFPEQLSGLVPDYLESVPIDPFGGKEFSALYSVGPDRDDDGGKVQYDATNGAMSRGDVYLR